MRPGFSSQQEREEKLKDEGEERKGKVKEKPLMEVGEQGNFYSQIEINRPLIALGLTDPALSGSHSPHRCTLRQLSVHTVIHGNQKESML